MSESRKADFRPSDHQSAGLKTLRPSDPLIHTVDELSEFVAFFQRK